MRATPEAQGLFDDEDRGASATEATRPLPTATSAPAHAGGEQPPPGDTSAPPARTAPSEGSSAHGASDVPQLSDGVELLGEYEGSGFKEPRYLIRRADGQLVQVTELLHLIAAEIDGSRSYAQIAERVTQSYGRGVSADNVRQLVDKGLRRDGIVRGADGAEPQLQKPDPLLGLKLKTTLLPEGAVNFFAALLRPLFWPPVILASVAGLVAVDVWYFGVHGIGQSLRDLIYQPLTMLLVYGLLILSVGWHELGHATACRYGGARPGRIGFGIYVVWPAFYTDVTDALRLGKAGRIRTDLGGVYFNALFAIVIAGVYFVTRFEPLLVLVLIQHVLMLYQFMPFLRLDGYHVISDITGIPDLFARIKPTLRSMKPGADEEREVTELKPWARTVVRLWVLTVIPVLLFLFGNMVLAAPRVIATAWDSLLSHWDKLQAALDDGQTAGAAVSGIQAAMVVLPVTGMGVTLARVAKRTFTGWMNLLRSRPVVGSLAGVAGAALVAGAVWVLIPNGEYRPIQPDEQWTVGESIEAVSDATTGRPSLTEERADELGGAPTLSEQEDATDVTTEPATEEEVDEEDTVDEDTTVDEEDDEAVVTEESPTPEETIEPSPTV